MDAMTLPSPATVTAWIALQRAQATAFASVERALKDADLPPLEWYDVLLELERGGPLRPRDLQARLLFAQYNLSRLIDRMVTADVVAREACPGDKRGQLVSITAAGLALRKRMWVVYGPAIEAAIGGDLDQGELTTLANLLSRVASSPAGVEACAGDEA
jgi:DNA-binding MarR family transcriptional regulator